MKTITKSMLLTLLLGFTALAGAQPSTFVEGTHYTELEEPVRTANPDKIEVTEVFWYGCGHCYSFEPLLESWVEKAPDDVEFVRSPGMWNEMMQTHAKIYYTAEALGVVDKVHPAAFNAIHQRGNYLENEEQVRELFVSQGVDPAEFDEAWNSFSVSSAVKKANARMRDYGVRSVPNLIVNGKYRVSAGGAVPTQQDMLEVADFLVQKERQES